MDHRNKLAQELSRGMRQKVAICCAYLHNPKAILVDEPLTGLDPHGIRTMKQSLRDRGDITLWISQDAIDAWTPPQTGKRGAQLLYSDIAIETALALRLLFHLPLR